MSNRDKKVVSNAEKIGVYEAKGCFKSVKVSAGLVYVVFDSDWKGNASEMAPGECNGLYMDSNTRVYYEFKAGDEIVLSTKISKLPYLQYFIDKHVSIGFKSVPQESDRFEIESLETL